jgi:DNA-binding XRE family transcriptional regulator
MALGTNARALAGMHGVEQRTVAQALGISKQGYYQIVSERHGPSLATARKLAALFGVTVDDLFGEEGDCIRQAAANYERAPIRQLAEHGSKL